MIQERAIYRIDNSNAGCRHGIVHTVMSENGLMWAFDTYWSNSITKEFDNNEQWYLVNGIEDRMSFVMMVDDAKEVTREEFYLYDDTDKLHIPRGYRGEKYLVNRNAKKSVDLVVESIRSKMISNDNMIKGLQKDNAKLLMWKKSILMNEGVAQLYKNEKYELDVMDAVDMFSRKKEDN
ncbi:MULTISPECIES: hypothetical protein [Paenibacillus]|uniref:hypothetical protein n=1 Tax=Paenibacillus TaxID=44249 RepID=UPI000B8701F3|nr:hypothetical protein [Paenibacillus amylolyticus]